MASRLEKDNWLPVHTKILILAQRSYKPKAVAEKLKIGQETVNAIYREPYFRERLNEITNKTLNNLIDAESKSAIVDKARDTLRNAAMKAAWKVRRIMNKGTSADRIQLDAAKDILDRVGLKPKEVIETRERVYTPEEIGSALETLKEVERLTERLDNQMSPFVVSQPRISDSESSETEESSPLLDADYEPAPEETSPPPEPLG